METKPLKDAVQTAATPAPEEVAPADALAAQIDALHQRHFADTTLSQHTPLWNAVHDFKEAVKALVASRG